MSKQHIQPRLIRMRDAPGYVGMDKRVFNEEVRPQIREIKIGKQGIAFDRLDLDAWVDQHIERECPAASNSKRRMKRWDAKERQVSKNAGDFGTLTKQSLDAEFAKVLAQISSKKLSST